MPDSGVTLIPVKPLGCVKGPGTVPGNNPLGPVPPPPDGPSGGSPPPSPGNLSPPLVLEPGPGSAYGRGPAGGIQLLELDVAPLIVASIST